MNAIIAGIIGFVSGVVATIVTIIIISKCQDHAMWRHIQEMPGVVNALEDLVHVSEHAIKCSTTPAEKERDVIIQRNKLNKPVASTTRKMV